MGIRQGKAEGFSYLRIITVIPASTCIIGFPALLILRRPLDTPLPFVPFLCAGGCAVYLLRLHGIVIAGYIP